MKNATKMRESLRKKVLGNRASVREMFEFDFWDDVCLMLKEDWQDIKLGILEQAKKDDLIFEAKDI